MEVVLGILVFLACVGSFLLGFYFRGLLLTVSEKGSVLKQIKKDIGMKPTASILSPSKKQKSEEILKDLPEEDEL